MTMNFLNDYPAARKWLYLIQWVINGLFAVLGAYFVAAGYAVDALPKWYVIPLAVAPVLWTYLGLQAGANTPSNAAPPPFEGNGDGVRDERGASDILYVLGVMVTLLAVILLITTLLKIFVVSWLAVIVLFIVGVGLLVWRGSGARLR